MQLDELFETPIEGRYLTESNVKHSAVGIPAILDLRGSCQSEAFGQNVPHVSIVPGLARVLVGQVEPTVESR